MFAYIHPTPQNPFAHATHPDLRVTHMPASRSHRPRNKLRGIFDQGWSRAWVSAAGGGVGVDEDGLYRFRNYMVSEVLRFNEKLYKP